MGWVSSLSSIQSKWMNPVLLQSILIKGSHRGSGTDLQPKIVPAPGITNLGRSPFCFCFFLRSGARVIDKCRSGDSLRRPTSFVRQSVMYDSTAIHGAEVSAEISFCLLSCSPRNPRGQFEPSPDPAVFFDFFQRSGLFQVLFFVVLSFCYLL